MDPSLLWSKFHIPHIKPHLVCRPRLLNLLDEGLGKKLIILSAPAGFGKTSLVADWLASVSHPAAWITLDEEDNDFARFIQYLVAGVQKLDPAIDNTAVELLLSPQPMLKTAALTALLNQIDDVQADTILVLDDFHLIDNADIHQAVEYLLNYLPINMHLVISTRSDPPINISRLRAQGELVEIRMEQLRFNEEEVRQFFQEYGEINISAENVSRLTKRTEGWISGLQMACLSLRGTRDVQQFVDSFSGSHKYILDYLIEEVLKQQSPQVQHFLLHTSLLERICGPLCDELLDTSDSQLVLQKLERENLFLIPLDDQRVWYRYHQLFRDLLQHRLSLGDAKQISALYQKASHWHEKEGWHGLAIEYALEAQDYELALRWIRKEAENTLMRAEVKTYQKWISRLPSDLVREDPYFEFLNTWCAILQGIELDRAPIEVRINQDQQSFLSGREETLNAFLYVSRGEFPLAGQLAEQALTKLKPDDQYFRSLAGWIIGILHALQRDVRGGLKVLEDLSTSLDLQVNPLMKVLLLSQAARAYVHIGDFIKAHQVYDQALESARDRQGNWIPIAGEALMALGDLLREQNRLDQATDLILEGIELTQQWRRAAAIEGYLFLSRVKQLQKNWTSANQALDKAMRLAVEYDVIEIDDRMVAMWQARLWCLENKPHLVEDWFQRSNLNEEVHEIIIDDVFNLENYLRSREQVVLARYFLLTSQLGKAQSLIQQLLPVFQKYGRLDLLIELYLLKCLAYHKNNEKDLSLMALGEAIHLDKQSVFVGLYLEGGDDLGGILKQYGKLHGTSADLQRLLQAFSVEPAETGLKAQSLIEPLSDRELDVLRYLPGNLTTPEIAEEMMISINTVRTHIKNIYQKFGVHKRSEAVRQAQELNLI